MTDSSQGRLPTLTARNEQIVDLIVRFGLLSSESLQRWLPGVTYEAARKTLERLVADRWLAKHSFPNGKAYFVLSSTACHRLTLKRNAMALRQRALIRRLLVLLHFSSHRELRLLTPAECREALPDIFRRGAANFFFIDSTDDSLGWICLDDGKPLARVRSKAVQTAAKKRTIEMLRDLAQHGKFKLLLLTTTDAKCEQLVGLFAAQPLNSMKLEISAVPECASLLGLTA